MQKAPEGRSSRVATRELVRGDGTEAVHPENEGNKKMTHSRRDAGTMRPLSLTERRPWGVPMVLTLLAVGMLLSFDIFWWLKR